MNVARFLPDDEWRGLRAAVLGLGSLMLLLAASGVVAATTFSQPSTTKYAVTVTGAAVVCLLATARMPLRLLVGVVIIAAPFNFVTTLAGLQITPLLAAELIAVLLALPRASDGQAAVRPMAVVFVVLLIPAIASSNGVGHWAVWTAVTVAAGWLVYVFARERGGTDFVMTMIVISGAIQAILAIYEFKTGRQLNLYTVSGSTADAASSFFRFGSLFRPSGALADPIGLGQMLALCLPFGIALSARVRGAWRTLAAFLAVSVTALGLLLSLSRMSIVGGGVGALAVLFLLGGHSRTKAIAGTAAVLGVVALAAASLAGSGLSRRLDSILHPTRTGVSTAQGDRLRQRIWKGALQTAEAAPLTGVGFGNITKYLPRHGLPITSAAHAHNSYLQFLAEGGIPGLIALLAVMAAAARDLLRAIRRERILVAGAAGALIATLTAWSTDVEIRYVQTSAMVAVVIGLAGALSARASEAERSAGTLRSS